MTIVPLIRLFKTVLIDIFTNFVFPQFLVQGFFNAFYIYGSAAIGQDIGLYGEKKM